MPYSVFRFFGKGSSTQGAAEDSSSLKEGVACNLASRDSFSCGYNTDLRGSLISRLAEGFLMTLLAYAEACGEKSKREFAPDWLETTSCTQVHSVSKNAMFLW